MKQIAITLLLTGSMLLLGCSGDTGSSATSKASKEDGANGEEKIPAKSTFPVAADWQALDMAAACTSDIISTADRESKNQFTFNGGRLASASWQRKNRSPEPGVPDDGRVQIPGVTPAGFFQVRMPPHKNAILLSGPEGVQPEPVTVELVAGERRRYSELAILQSSCWGEGTLQVLLRYETGAETTAALPVFDWSVKGRTAPLPAEVRVAVRLHGIHPKFGAPAEMHAHRIPVDPKRTLRSLTLSIGSLRPLKGVQPQVGRQRFTSAVFGLSAQPVSTIATAGEQKPAPVTSPEEAAPLPARPAKSAAPSRPAGSARTTLAFTEDGQGYLRFDTGIVKGRLKKDGNGDFFKPISFVDPAVPMDNNRGLLVPYRFLTPRKRYGFGSWEWPRTGRILPDGAAELAWAEAPGRPFRFTATYAWTAANTLDLRIAFTPAENLEKFELFVGSYLKQFTKAVVYVKDSGDGEPGFVDTPGGKGKKQLFPRDEGVVPMIRDGRWQHPPYPNDWTFRSWLQAPLGVKSQPKTGVAVVIMAPPEDCFAVSMFEQNAPLGCYYLSLFGKDVKKGQTLVGRARMVFGKNITNEDALRMYREYLDTLGGR